MTTILRDIIDQKHDMKACKTNCAENGKVFNQSPFQCHYFSNDEKYNNLLKHQEFNDSDILDDVKVASKSTKDKIVEYQFQLSLLGDLKADVDDGVRAKEDLNELEQNLGNL